MRGAAFSATAELSITNTTIENNHSDKYGGGISVWGASGTLEIVGSTLSGNSAAQEGGAIENSSSAVRNARRPLTISLTGETTNGEALIGTDDVDLFFSGKALRNLLDELALGGVL